MPNPRENFIDFGAHAMPVLTLLLEWSINSIEFEWKRSLWVFMYIVSTYQPMQIVCKQILGFYPYGDEDNYSVYVPSLNTNEAYLYVVIATMFYIPVALITNLVKGSGRNSFNERAIDLIQNLI